MSLLNRIFSGAERTWGAVKQCIYADDLPVEPTGSEVEVEISSGVLRVQCDFSEFMLSGMMAFFGLPLLVFATILITSMAAPEIASATRWTSVGVGLLVGGGAFALLRHGIRVLNRRWSVEIRPDEALIRHEPVIGRNSETRFPREAFEHIEIMGPDHRSRDYEGRHRLVGWTQIGEFSLMDGGEADDLVFVGRAFHHWANRRLFDDGKPRIQTSGSPALTMPDEDRLEHHRYEWLRGLDEDSRPRPPKYTNLEIETDVDQLGVDIPGRDVGNSRKTWRFGVGATVSGLVGLIASLVWHLYYVPELMVGPALVVMTGVPAVLLGAGLVAARRAVGWQYERQRIDMRVDYLSIERWFFGISSVELFSRHDIVDVDIRECDNREGHPMFAVDIELPDRKESVVQYCSRADQLFVARIVRQWCDGVLFDERGRLKLDVEK